MLLLIGCGPERSGGNSEQLEVEAERIAAEYVGDGDIGRAVAQIDALEGVADPKQWFLLLTERYITDGEDADTIASLVNLTIALGLDSTTVSTYAKANGLLAVPEVAADPIVVVATPVTVQQPADGAAEEPSNQENAPATADDAPSDDGQQVGNGESATPSDVLLPTPTPAPLPTVTPESPKLRADSALNVRRGPGLLYDIVGGLQSGEELDILAKNDAADWWQVNMPGDLLGWVYGPLVQTIGDVNSVAVAANIPPPPDPAPVVEEPVPVPEATQPETTEPEAPAQEEAPASSPDDKPHFTLVKTRLWEKYENDGCAGKHLLRVHVFDANGNRLNGVALQGIYTGEILVTGSQGKGDGVIEYDLYSSGEGFRVIRDNDGREASSDNADGFTTRSVDIPKDLLINANYCTDSANCDVFYASWGCQGHHSWEAEFRRNY